MSSTVSNGRDHQRLQGDDGASLVEYALLVALIALVCLGALRMFQHNVSQSLSRSASSITQSS